MIVSIEMFEAVGERYWPRYFQTVPERLKRGGRAVIQTITVRDERLPGLSHAQRLHPPICVPRRHAAFACPLSRGSLARRV